MLTADLLRDELPSLSVSGSDRHATPTEWVYHAKKVFLLQVWCLPSRPETLLSPAHARGLRHDNIFKGDAHGYSVAPLQERNKPAQELSRPVCYHRNVFVPGVVWHCAVEVI